MGHFHELFIKKLRELSFDDADLAFDRFVFITRMPVKITKNSLNNST